MIPWQGGSRVRLLAVDVCFERRWFRTLIGLFFLLSGASVSLILLAVGPSFWYFPCAVLWAASGFVWMIQPSLAAGLSVFPVLAFVALIVQTLPNLQTDSFARFLLLCVAIALALITAAFRRRDARRVVPLAISLCLVVAAFGVDRAFTNKLAIHTYSMQWSVNGTAPWGNVEADEKGQAPVVIYRKLEGGYCYDAVFSPELKSRLIKSNKTLIRVEYNVFSDFGHERSYNIRSIDGLVFNDGHREFRSTRRYGGYIEGSLRPVDCQR